MTDDEFVCKMQANIVQSANALADQTNTPREAIAQFLRTVAKAPGTDHTQQVIAQVLKHAAEEIHPGTSTSDSPGI